MNDTPNEFVRVPRDELTALREILAMTRNRETHLAAVDKLLAAAPAQHADDEAAVKRAAQAIDTARFFGRDSGQRYSLAVECARAALRAAYPTNPENPDA